MSSRSYVAPESGERRIVEAEVEGADGRPVAAASAGRQEQTW
ncbi:hypothetical protein ABTY20_25400 [Streptomyces sp. NPDC126497]